MELTVDISHHLLELRVMPSNQHQHSGQQPDNMSRTPPVV